MSANRRRVRPLSRHWRVNRDRSRRLADGSLRVDRNGTDQYTRVRTDRRHRHDHSCVRVSGREYARGPVGVGTFAGLAVVAGWLNAAGLEQATIIDETPLVHHATATYVLGAVVVSAVAAEIGRRIGDEVARDVFDINRLAATGEIASLVRSARLSIAIQLPERIDDAAGYPPVDPSIKRDLAGRTVLVPRSATNRHFALDSRPASSAITVSATCRSRSEQTGPSSDSRSAALALESGRAFQREPSRWRSVPIRHRPQASAIRSRSGHPKRTRVDSRRPEWYGPLLGMWRRSQSTPTPPTDSPIPARAID